MRIFLAYLHDHNIIMQKGSDMLIKRTRITNDEQGKSTHMHIVLLLLRIKIISLLFLLVTVSDFGE